MEGSVILLGDAGNTIAVCRHEVLWSNASADDTDIVMTDGGRKELGCFIQCEDGEEDGSRCLIPAPRRRAAENRQIC